MISHIFRLEHKVLKKLLLIGLIISCSIIYGQDSRSERVHKNIEFTYMTSKGFILQKQSLDWGTTVLFQNSNGHYFSFKDHQNEDTVLVSQIDKVGNGAFLMGGTSINDGKEYNIEITPNYTLVVHQSKISGNITSWKFLK